MTINPGSGPVEDAFEDRAAENMDAFAADLGARGLIVGHYIRDEDADRGEGRYGYVLHMVDGREISVRMPGLPLEQVRYLGPPQDAWDYPRLYVNGSSWLWRYALNICAPDDEDE